MAQTKRKLAKMSRREGIALSESISVIKALQRRPYAPGVHGPNARRPRVSTYGTQLREKQKAKRIFNLRERQFRNYFKKASQSQGDTGAILVRLLETRLDNVVFRLGLAKTRQQARQMVGHKFFTVNGRPVNIPSFSVKPGDEIQLKATKKEKPLVTVLKDRKDRPSTPSWLSADHDAFGGKVLTVPEGEELQQPFDPTLIIEYYSR